MKEFEDDNVRFNKNDRKFSKSVENTKPHSSVGSVVDLRTGGRWFDRHLGQYSFSEIGESQCNGVHASLTAVHCFDNGYVGKQPVAWEEYCAEYWSKELQEAWVGALAAAM